MWSCWFIQVAGKHAGWKFDTDPARFGVESRHKQRASIPHESWPTQRASLRHLTQRIYADDAVAFPMKLRKQTLRRVPSRRLQGYHEAGQFGMAANTRYRDTSGKEHAKHFARKVDAQGWLDEVTTAVGTGTYVDPKTARMTVGQWCDTWLTGYRTRRASTVRQAEVHIAKIREAFGTLRLGDIKPSQVRAWCATLKADGYADSIVYALHSRLSQIMSDAVHDGVIARNPCSRRTSPRAGKQRPYVATTEQVWALHERCPCIFALRCCWGRLRACGSLRRAVCGSPMWTSCAASWRLMCSTRPSRSSPTWPAQRSYPRRSRAGIVAVRDGGAVAA